MDIDYELQLTDFIDADMLQRMQDAFTELTGIAAITADTNGVPVTEGSGFSDYCMKFTRNSASGGMRCAQCDKEGAEMALQRGEACVYYCHAGLMDFAAPITANGKLIGSFIGGQVLTEPLEMQYVKRIAVEINVDPYEYIEAAKKIRVMKREEIEKAARFLYTMAGIISDMAYTKYLAYYSNAEMEKTANLKSDFLANMSHEIRTPMNAVIGMAEMALREDMSHAAREYINQIKTSGRSLLTIINDILDFSKIESGKMDINVVEYEPMSMVSDVANIVMTRLKGKDVELILDVSPTLPSELLGDNIRIKQVMINIANNAAKFTVQGKVAIKIDYEQVSAGEIKLSIQVEDTGIGIKKEDIKNLFQSFQQLDSKRNRNIEGTGLGLAISKQLLNLMNGKIRVESEYGKGSRFSFEIPQKVIDKAPSISVRNPDSILVAGYISNPLVRDRFYADVESLGVAYVNICSVKDLASLPCEKKIFFFVEHPLFAGEVEQFVLQSPQISTILLIDFYDKVDYDMPNLLVLKKPLFALNIATVLNEEKAHFGGDTEEKEFDFVAPEAKILIVDDNAVNLTVAEGLLEPLKMQIDTASTGKIAIDKISRVHYDIVFMDHMMPELDGVETTHIIRRFHKEYDDVPIIAFTANAVEGTKEMFCREGMNDFIAKPIELRMMVSKIRQWLPLEKIQKSYAQFDAAKDTSKVSDIKVGNLDITFALKYLGSEDLFWSILKVYYRSIEKKAALIKSMEEKEDWAGYTIEVHALKSSSKQIGAILLSEKAAALEKAGNARNAMFIHSNTDDMLELYRGYLQVLEPFCKEEEEDGKDGKEEISKDRLLRFFGNLRSAMDELDMDRMFEVVTEMRKYHYEGWQQELFTELRNAVEEIDVETCEGILKKWESGL